MRLISYLLIAMPVTFSTLYGGSGGSAYSRYGLGDIRHPVSSRAAGMGGAGIALSSGTSIDRLNPAAWMSIRSTRFSAGTLYEGYAARDRRGSVFLSGMSFDGAMFAVPVATAQGIVFVAGITPYSRVNYDVVSPPVNRTDLDYTLEYIGDGGLSVAQTGFSLRPQEDLALGAKLNYYFGTLDHTLKQTFPSGQFTNAEFMRSTTMNGLGGTLGLLYSGARSIFGLPEGQTLNIGFVLSTTASLNSSDERYYTYTTSSRVTRDTTTSDEFKIRLPVAFASGIAYQSEAYALTADMHYQNWDRFTVAGEKPAEIRDSYRFSVGGELIPSRAPDARAFQRWAYRLGLYYHSTYYQVRGEPINEIGATFGFGIPLFADTRINLGGSYSLRGTTDQQLQKDRVLRISLTLDTGELWFSRRPEE